ncbi:MAG: hypothetical protein QM650_05050 [Microlunatus sp.]
MISGLQRVRVAGVEERELDGHGSREEVLGECLLCGADPVKLGSEEADEFVELGVVVQIQSACTKLSGNGWVAFVAQSR